MTRAFLEVEGLSLRSRKAGGGGLLVDDVSLSVGAGGSLGIVGESGSGKSLTLKALIGCLPPGIMLAGGDIWVDGIQVVKAGREISKTRHRGLGLVFQEPTGALDPLTRVGNQIAEVYRATKGDSWAKSKATAIDLIDAVGIEDAPRRASAFPHQLSGGQRQRIIMAIALAKQPRLLLCDEPTTALDTATQAQILSLIETIRRQRGISIVFVSHDLSAVSHLCESVSVMRLGRIVETGSTASVIGNPKHSYTKSLIGSQLQLEGAWR